MRDITHCGVCDVVLTPDELDAVLKADRAHGAELQALAVAYGYPAERPLPGHCGPCGLRIILGTVLFSGGWDLTWQLIDAYERGAHGWPQSVVMAYSWTFFYALCAYEDGLSGGTADPYAAGIMHAQTLVGGLTAEEIDAAQNLAREAFCLSFSARWQASAPTRERWMQQVTWDAIQLGPIGPINAERELL